MEEGSKVESLIDNLKEYAETRFDIGVLTVQDKTATILSSIAVAFIIGLLAVFVILFASIGTAWMLGKKLQNISLGFFIVAGFYLLVSIIILLNREKWITVPIINGLLKQINVREKD